MIKISSSKIRILKTAALYFSAIASGMNFSVVGPTLLDFQHIVNTDTKRIAFIYTARSNGYLFGSLIGGVIFDMTSRTQLVMTILNFVISMSIFAFPWSRSVEMLTSLMVLNGAFIGALDTGLNVCVLHLWGKDSGPFYQALHFVYGVGGLLAPLVAAQFLANYNEPIFNETTSINTTLFSEFFNSTLPAPTDATIPPITYTYGILSSVAAAVTVCFFVLCIISPFDDTCQKKDETPTRKRGWMFVSIVVFINFLLLFVETGTEIGYAQMLTTYAVKGPLKLSKSVGSYMTSTFWAAFSVSRFASIFLAIKLSSFTLLLLDIVVTSAGALVLLFLGGQEEWALWLATFLLGIGIASFFPAAVAWVEQYIDVNNKIVSVFAVGAAFGEMVIPYTISYFIEEVPEVLSYTAVSSCVLAIILIFVMYLVLRNKQIKYLTEEGTVNEACEKSITI